MNKKLAKKHSTHIWPVIIYNGLALGVIMGLLEVCWTYILPTIFPMRRYELPVSTIGWFILSAITLDVMLVLALSLCLGLLTLIFRKIFKSSLTLNTWAVLFRFALIFVVMSYLYRGYLYIYFVFDNTGMRFKIAIAGIAVILLIAAALVWFLETLRKKSRKQWSLLLWLSTVVILSCVIFFNYRAYRTDDSEAVILPTIKAKNRPNVLLVTLDTLRADHLACYGNKVIKTPCLDSIANDGTLFKNAFAQSPLTTPSHCTIMTSTYQARHGAFNGVAMRRGFPTLAQVLQKNGYITAAFVSAAPVRSSNSGLHHGFDYYEDSLSPYTELLRHDELQLLLTVHMLSHLQHHQIDGSFVSQRAISWLNNKSKSPFFCWLHYYDTHTPYDAPEPYKNMYAEQIDPKLPSVSKRVHYAGEVTYTDFQLSRVIEHLKQEDIYDNTLIIITADHGEAFGEQHGKITEFGHGNHLYDTTQHVPLIIKLPREKDSQQCKKEVVQLLDLAPTVLDYLETPNPVTFQGKTLLDLLIGENSANHESAFAELVRPDMTVKQINVSKNKNRRLMSIRTSQIKFICDTIRKRQELYDIQTNPAETVNLYSERIESANKYYSRIKDTLGQPSQNEQADIDPAVLEQLRTLGYIGDNEKSDEK